MQIERGASNTLVVMARVTLSPSYWLLHFTDIERGGNAYCVVEPGNSGGAFISLTFTETTAPVALDGEVLLAPPGNWNVKIYEQTSSTNLVPASANRLVKDVDIFVVGDGVADGGWTETCPTDGDECDPLSLRVNGQPYASITDPCGAIATVDVEQNGAAVGSLVGGVWVIPTCDDLSYSLVNSNNDELDGGSVRDPCGEYLTVIAPDANIRTTNTLLNVAQVPSGNTYDLPQTSVMYANAFGITQLFLTDTTFDGLNLQTTDHILTADLLNSLGNVVGAAKVTAADLMNDTVPIAPDGTITFDGLAVGTVPSGDTENLDCGTLLNAAYVQDGGSVTGTYLITGTLNGRNVYTLDVDHNLEYTGSRWRLVKPGSDVDAALGSETFPWDADWSATSVTVQQATIGAYCGGEEVPCADLTVTVNGTEYSTVADPCGATADVDVEDSDGNPVGSLVGGVWVVPTLCDLIGDVAAGDIETEVIDCMDDDQKAYANMASTCDLDAQAWISVVEALDGQFLEVGVRQAVCDLVTGLKADGIWTKLKAVGLLSVARTFDAAFVPLKGPQPTVFNFVSGDYDRKTGLVGNGSSKYLNTNRNNNADSQDDQAIGVWLHTALGIGDAAIGAGATENGASHIIRRTAPNDAQLGFRSRSASVDGIAGGTSTGYVGLSRTSSTGFTARLAGSDNSITRASQTPYNSNVMVFVTTTAAGGGFFGYTSARMRFYHVGEGITLADLDSRLTTFFTAVDAIMP